MLYCVVWCGGAKKRAMVRDVYTTTTVLDGVHGEMNSLLELEKDECKCD